MTSAMNDLIHCLRSTALLRDGAGLTDKQLLDEYLNRREEPALAALVRRHGSMVWGVCRRVLRHHHDAEDAFQATFLVFVRRAASIASRELLANWLYGVAHQTALKARATTAKRRTRERQVMEMPEPAPAGPDLWRDLQPLLDHEVSRLPEKYRVLIVLCDLEGKTRKEAARQLGCPEGTVAGRLARARALLAKRLTRQGLVLTAAAMAMLLAENAASASAPVSVVSNTIKAATVFAAGPAAAAGVVSAPVVSLTQGVLNAMLLNQLKVATVVILGVVICVGAGTAAFLPTAAGKEAGAATTTKTAADDKKADKDKLQGKWVPVSAEVRGRKLDTDNMEVQQKLTAVFGFWKLTFEGDNFIKEDDQKVGFTLMPTNKPKEMDIEIGGQVGILKAIYEFDGEKLKLSWVHNGDRPSDFDTSKSNGFAIVYEKKKE